MCLKLRTPMSPRQSSILHRTVSVLLCSGTLIAGVPLISVAQSNPGFSFVWGGDGPGRRQQLSYVLEYGTPGHMRDRYRLQLGRQNTAISSIRVDYPDYYDGQFSENRISLRRTPKNRIFNFNRAEEIPLASATVDNESRIIEIVPEEDIPAGVPVEVVLSNVRNPRSGGMYYFNAWISSPNDVLVQPVGTWILSIFRS